MIQNNIIVIGAGIGGLSAAINTKIDSPECEVLLFEKNQDLGGKARQINEKGYILDMGPSIVIMPWVYANLFKLCGEDITQFVEFKKIEIPFRFVYQRKEYYIPTGKQEFLKYLKFNMPDDFEFFEKYFEKLESINILAKERIFEKPILGIFDLMDIKFLKQIKHIDLGLKFKKYIDKNVKSPVLKAFMYSLPNYIGQTYNSNSFGSHALFYTMINEGIFEPIGGVGSIVNALYLLAKKIGVKVSINSELKSLVLEKNEIKEAVINANGLTSNVSCKVLISNEDKVSFLNKYLSRNLNFESNYSYLTVHLGIKKKVDSLKYHNWYIPSDFEKYYFELFEKKIVANNPIIYINKVSANTEKLSPIGCDNLFIVIPVFSDLNNINFDEIKDQFLSFILKQFEKFEIDIAKEDIELFKVQTPKTFNKLHNNFKGSLYGPGEKNWFLRSFPLKNNDTIIQNLFFAGSSVQPGAGMPMVTLSGKFAADMAKNYLNDK